MGKAEKKTVWYAGCVFLLLSFAYFARVFSNWTENLLLKTVSELSRHLIQMGLLTVWFVSIRRRIMQKTVCRYLQIVAGLMMFWLYIRAVKWMFFYGYSAANRYCWYAFYLPIIFIPLLGAFVVQYIGKPEDYEMPRRMKLLYIPAGILLALIFTNDFHHLAFAFPEMVRYDDTEYTYGIAYFAVLVWAGILGIYFIGNLLMKSRAPGRRQFRQLPAVILGGAAFFWLLYGLKLVNYDLTAVSCLVIVLLLESSIQSGLIRSNSRYGALFGASTIEARILDRDEQICYASETAGALEEGILRMTEQGPVNLGNKRFSSAEISNGRILWCDDIMEINRFAGELEETGRQLARNNAILKEELELREKHLRILEESRLYEQVMKEVSGKLDQVETLLEDDGASGTMRENLIQVCILSVYVKRRSNLLLMGENHREIPALELEFCLRESLEQIRLTGALCSLECECMGRLGAKVLACAYDVFEQMIEQALEGLQALLVKGHIADGSIFLRLWVDCGRKLQLPENTDWISLGGTMEIKESEGAVLAEFRLEEGGRME
ncbi:MAG: histidine kinase N-terminal 7TM domain-containing protein [Candidatus Limivivens sp.]|nr:histidine kinase N-terminal 7TM domain-containing protein [Candidatus Limivivens sp.]